MGGGGGGVGEADIAIFKLGSGCGGGCTDATFGDRPVVPQIYYSLGMN